MKSTARRQLDALADELTDRELGIITATVQAVLYAREKESKHARGTTE